MPRVYGVIQNISIFFFIEVTTDQRHETRTDRPAPRCLRSRARGAGASAAAAAALAARAGTTAAAAAPHRAAVRRARGLAERVRGVPRERRLPPGLCDPRAAGVLRRGDGG